MTHIDTAQLTQWRQDLHKIPELGLKEHKIAAYIRAVLDSLGLPYNTIIDKGTTVFIDVEAVETVAFRADIDALPLEEQTGVPFSSTHTGKMHACGHDGHTTILLGFAHYLATHKRRLKKNILLIFQPAEEGPGGGAMITNTGLLRAHCVSHIFGLHIFPEIEEGVIAAKAGPLMAQCSMIDVTILGKSAHGAMPEDGIDAIVIAGQLIGAYQSILTRRMDPINPYVLTLGTINGGNATNIIADQVNITGTIRTFSNADMDKIKAEISAINKGLEQMHHCRIMFDSDDGYSAVINDATTYDIFKKGIEAASLPFTTLLRPYMTAEDFSAYQTQVPGLFFFLGSRNSAKGFTHALHNCRFNFDEKILARGIEAFIATSNAFG